MDEPTGGAKYSGLTELQNEMIGVIVLLHGFVEYADQAIIGGFARSALSPSNGNPAAFTSRHTMPGGNSVQRLGDVDRCAGGSPVI